MTPTGVGQRASAAPTPSSWMSNVVEHAGRTTYSSKLEATIVLGIGPGMVAFDASKQNVLNDIFIRIAELVT